MNKNQLLEMFPIGDPSRSAPGMRGAPLLDPISAITGGIGLVGSLIGGSKKASAANTAAQIQMQAAKEAGKQVTDATAAANPLIGEAASRASEQVKNAAAAAAAGATGAAQTAGQGVTAAAQSANSRLDPYATAGSNAAALLDAGVAPGGEFNRTPGVKDLQMDPGYEWRLRQGQQALERAASARGGLNGGAELKAITNYSQGAASQEYQNAFARFQQGQAQRYAQVKGVANSGQAAATTQGGNETGAARYTGDINYGASQYSGNVNNAAAQYAGTADMNSTNLMSSNSINAARAAAEYLTQGANAEASGKVGSANAWGDALNGGINAATGALSMYNANKNAKKYGNPAVRV